MHRSPIAVPHLTLLAIVASVWLPGPAAAQSRADGDEPPTEPSLPIATSKPVEPPAPPPPSEDHPPEEPPARSPLAALISFELGAQGAHVDLDGAKTGVGGALSGHMFILGFSTSMTYRLVVNGALGGQTTGFLTCFGGDASVGPAIAITETTRLFARIGMEAHGHKDDELDTSLFTLPSAYAGLQVVTKNAVFEIGPRAGATLRAVYAPGDETEGRRHSRRSRVAPSWGGALALVSPILLVEGSLTRVEQTAGMWLAEGTMCPLLTPEREEFFLMCASAQYWRGAVRGTLGDVTEVGSWVLGASIGFGFGNKRRQ